MNATSVKSLLTLYGNASGQRVNFDKYLIYFISNVDTDCKDLIASMLGVRISSNPEKYLGLPTMVGRSKKEAFSYFYDRFNAKVNSWGCGVCLWVVKRCLSKLSYRRSRYMPCSVFNFLVPFADP
ncbi:hypothetical protein V6N13_141610 [Hibiscus sabdariffa]